MGNRVRVKLFARLREMCGRDEVEFDLPAGADPRACFRRLAAEHPPLEELEEQLMVAVNEEYAAWDHPLEDGDEVCFIPPVSGGR